MQVIAYMFCTVLIALFSSCFAADNTNFPLRQSKTCPQFNHMLACSLGMSGGCEKCRQAVELAKIRDRTATIKIGRRTKCAHERSYAD